MLPVNYKYLFISISCCLFALIGSYYFFVEQDFKVDTYSLIPNITNLDDKSCNTKQIDGYNNFTESLSIATRDLAKCKLLYNPDYLTRFVSGDLYFKTAPSPDNEKIILTFIYLGSKGFVFNNKDLTERFYTSYNIHTRKIREVFAGNDQYSKNEALDFAIKICADNIIVMSTPEQEDLSVLKCLAKNNNDGLILNYSGVSINEIHSFSFKNYYNKHYSFFILISGLFFVLFIVVFYILIYRLSNNVDS